MSEKESLAQKLHQKWSAIQAKKEPPPRCFIGFDGFTDEIIKAVDQRSNQSSYSLFSTIQQFGDRIVKAAGKSCNIELVVEKIKLGGNAPIMTNALLEGGHQITFCGPIGEKDHIEPIFQEMASRCTHIIALGSSAHSDAIEFEDGKVIFGKMDALKNVNFDTLLAHLPLQELIVLLDEADLFVCANWTMLPMMNDLWERILRDVTPHFKEKKKRYLFVDLADPAKRVDADIKKAIELLEKLNTSFEVYLGLNQAEAQRIELVLSGKSTSDQPEALAESLKKLMNIQCIVVHGTKVAASAGAKGLHLVQGPYTPTPRLTTGAGDNFNAGFCNALLYDFNPQACLLSGVATSGYYVRNGHSPTIPELCDFLRQWDAQKLE